MCIEIEVSQQEISHISIDVFKLHNNKKKS